MVKQNDGFLGESTAGQKIMASPEPIKPMRWALHRDRRGQGLERILGNGKGQAAASRYSRRL